MNLYQIKLMNGDDIIAFLQEDGDYVTLTNPIQFVIDPDRGVFAKSWLVWAHINEINIQKEKILFFTPANIKTIGQYILFNTKSSENLPKYLN